MLNFTSHNNKRIKYCVYRCTGRSYELIAMTLDLKRVESLVGIKLTANIEDFIKEIGDVFTQGDYLIKAESFKYL